MIPDFKTYINESHWSEMNRRSQGIKTRREDDVNNLDREDFSEYLKRRYNVGDDIIYNSSSTYSINIKLLENEVRVMRLWIMECDKPEKVLLIPNVLAITKSKLYEIIKDRYIFEITNEYSRFEEKLKVLPKDKNAKVDNKFIVSFIDDVIDNICPPFETKLNYKK